MERKEKKGWKVIRKEGREEGRNEGRKEGKKEGGKEGRIVGPPPSSTIPISYFFLSFFKNYTFSSIYSFIIFSSSSIYMIAFL